MTTATAISGFNTLLKIGDGGVGAGTQASKTVSTSNQQIIAKAQIAGVDGNSKTFGIVVSGASTSFSYTISETSLVITSATDGSSAATTTVNEAIYQIQDDPVYREFWELTRGAGNGTGVLVASATSALSGGADGTEAFTLIGDVTSIKLAGRNRETVDVTHMTSTDGYREFITTLRDSGTIDFEFNCVPGNASLDLIDAARASDDPVNFQIVWPNDVTYQMAGLVVTGPDIGAVVDDKITGSCSIKITGPVDTEV